MTDRYLKALRTLAAGRTRSFQQLAAGAGRPGAARAAGAAIARCPTRSAAPWHRVVAADGSLARDPERARVQLRRLRCEGARPRAREPIRAWAARVGAGWIGCLPKRLYAPADDPRVDRWPPTAVEPLFSEHDAPARGLRPIDAPAAEQRPMLPRPGRRVARGRTLPLCARLDAVDWERAHRAIAFDGWSRLKGLLSAGECAGLLEDAGRRPARRFERSVDMLPQGFGVGVYHYYREPLPQPARTLRRLLYERLQPLANAYPWRGRNGAAYPPTLEAFWRRCRAAGQRRGSTILLCYGQGGVNHPHRDIYGPEWFPVQGVVILSRRGRDFEGGELVVVDDHPQEQRRQRIEVTRGDLVVFGSRQRWEQHGARVRKVPLRHGMDPVQWGERYALGIVFHLAR